MIRRNVFAGAAATALILAPGTALAQPAQNHQPQPPSHHQPDPPRGHDDHGGHGGHGGHGDNGGHGDHGHHGHYEADGYRVTASDPTPCVNARDTIFLRGAGPREKVTLTITHPDSARDRGIEIAGTKSLVKTTDAKGVAAFTVSMAATGSYPMRLTDASGALLGTSTLTVVAASAGPAGPASTDLSPVGFAGVGLPIGALGLVLVGGGIVVATKGRGRAKTHV